MRTIKSLNGQRRSPTGIGPNVAFAGAILTAAATWTGLIVTIPAGLAMPVVTTLLLVFAACLALLAWRPHREDPARVTYADVAGALTLIGLCAAATIDPDEFTRLLASDPA